MSVSLALKTNRLSGKVIPSPHEILPVSGFSGFRERWRNPEITVPVCNAKNLSSLSHLLDTCCFSYSLQKRVNCSLQWADELQQQMYIDWFLEMCANPILNAINQFVHKAWNGLDSSVLWASNECPVRSKISLIAAFFFFSLLNGNLKESFGITVKLWEQYLL